MQGALIVSDGKYGTSCDENKHLVIVVSVHTAVDVNGDVKKIVI